jgi:membrane protease YdiL (CAAX protease family)
VRTALLALLPAAAVTIGVRFGAERLWIGVLLYHTVCVAAPAISRLSRQEAGLAHPGGRAWAWGAAACAPLLVAGIRLVGFEIYRRGWIFPAATRDLLLRIEPWWPGFAYSVLVNPFMEELYWRGFLLQKTGVAAGAIAFAFMHFAGLAVYVSVAEAALLSLPALGAGFAWGWMRRRSASLWPCIATHAAADAGILALFTAIRGA